GLAQFVEIVCRKRRERFYEGQAAVDPAVDLFREEVVLQLNVYPFHPRQLGYALPDVGCHHEGEVGRAPKGGQPEAHSHHATLDAHPADEPEFRQWLIQLRIVYLRQLSVDLVAAHAPVLHALRASPHGGHRILGELFLLHVDVDAIDPRRVLAEDLLLDVQGEGHPELFLDVIRKLERHELLHDPAGVPDRVVAGKEQLVGADPPQEIGQHLGEIARTAVDEWHHHSQAAVNIALLGGDPAEIFKAGQPTVLDDEVEISERGGGFVDVSDIERITVEGPDGRPLVHVNVLDPEFSALLQKTVGPRIGELPSPGISLPLGGVELDAPDSEAMDQRLEVLEARFAVPRVPGTVED